MKFLSSDHTGQLKMEMWITADGWVGRELLIFCRQTGDSCVLRL